jgi:hypothetical protein
MMELCGIEALHVATQQVSAQAWYNTARGNAVPDITKFSL